MKKRQHRIILGLGIILLGGLCLVITFTTLGSGLTLWFGLNQVAKSSPATLRPTRRSLALPPATLVTNTPSPTATAIPTLVPTDPPTPTPTPLPTHTDTPTPLPPSSTPTPLPPTATPLPTQPPPTITPTATPTPSFSFVVAEVEQFPTNHLNFDVYVAITDANNKPLSGYRVLGQHSSGLQIESQVSANEWTANSGAMHYKAGNIKYEVFNSPGGIWILQLVDEAGQPAAPSLEFAFDASNPTWYFVLYRQTE